MKNKRIIKRMLWILLALVTLWIVGDFGYSRYVSAKLRHWESTVERDQNGVMKDCEAFSLGQSDTAVLLIHGINDTPYSFRKLAPNLAEKFHVRAMRMPGFGEPLEACAKKKSEDWIDKVKLELEQLRKSHRRVFVVAHSLGGAVTIQTVLQAKDNQPLTFDGVVLLAPAIEVSNRRSPVLPTRVWHNLSAGLLFTNMTYNPFGNDCQDSAERDSANRVPFSPRSMIDETFKLIDMNRGRASEFSLPVLLVLSEQDQVNDHLASERWFGEIASPRKEVYWNNRSGHALQYDLGWQEVASKIAEFIESETGNND